MANETPLGQKFRQAVIAHDKARRATQTAEDAWYAAREAEGLSVTIHTPDCDITKRGPQGRNMPTLCTCGGDLEAENIQLRTERDRYREALKRITRSAWARPANIARAVLKETE